MEAVAHSRPTASEPKGDLLCGILTASDERLKQTLAAKQALTKHKGFLRQPPCNPTFAATSSGASLSPEAVAYVWQAIRRAFCRD
jgi:hypothetical protein